MHASTSLRFIAIALLGASLAAPAYGFSLTDTVVREALKIARAPLQYQSPGKAPAHQPATEGMSVTHGAPNGSCSQFQAYGYPVVAPKVVQRAFYTCRTGYAGLYDPSPKSPLWIAERLRKGQWSGNASRKGLEFAEDPQIPLEAQARLTSYRGSGMDRGHMAPAADFASSPAAMAQSFLLTNIVPQESSHNQGIWANLEGAVREMAERRGELYVITGPVFSSADRHLRGGVRVPAALYKVVVDPARKEMTAFFIPNEPGQGDDPARFQVSVRDIERVTGLDFNPALPRADADRMETGGGAWLIPKVRIKFRD